MTQRPITQGNNMRNAIIYMTIVFLVASNLFGLINVEGIFSLLFSSNMLLFALCGVGAVAALVSRKNGGLKVFGSYFGNYFGLFLFSVTFVALLTLIEFRLADRFRVFARWGSLLTLFFVFPALAYCKRAPRGIVDLMVVFERAASVGCLLYILNALFFQATGSLILPGQSFLGDFEHASVRYFLVRLSVPAIFDFTTIFSFVMLLTTSGGERREHIFAFAVGVCAIVLVAQSRAEIAAIAISIFVALVLRFGHEHPYLCLISAGILALILLAITGLFSNILGLFMVNGNLERSTMIRSDSTDYYLSVFTQNPLIGFGFIVGSPSYYSLEHGISGLAWTSDVGFVGQLAQWGVFFLVLFVLSCARAIYVTLTCWRRSRIRLKCLMAAFLCYLAVTSYSLIILSVVGGLCFPLFVVIFESIAVECKDSSCSDVSWGVDYLELH